MHLGKLFDLLLDKFIGLEQLLVQGFLVGSLSFENIDELLGFKGLVENFLDHGETDVLSKLIFRVSKELLVQ